MSWLFPTSSRAAQALVVCATLVVLSLHSNSLFAAPGNESEAATLRRKQDAQQKARLLTRELVSSILDVQLQQLKENGLEELPIYGEIQMMRKNINQLVDAEMQKVVDLLVKAQQGDKPQREQAFKDARVTIREVVMKLSIERQNLLRRLKTAEIVAHVRRLISLETTAMKTTGSLSELPAAQREQKTLVTIEDQRDVQQLFLQLEQVLRDVSRWGGSVGEGAAEGQRLLQEGKVGTELETAGKNLEETKFTDATQHQQAAIAGLRKLLEKVEAVQGLLNTERQQAIDAVHDLAKKQEALREATRKADPKDAEKLVEQQATIKKELEKLTAQVTAPAAQALLDQAKLAAKEATEELFNAQPEKAEAEQGKVLGNLAELQAQLQADVATNADKSAEQFAKLVADLEQAKADVAKLQEQQSAAEKQPAAEAAAQEKQIAAETAKVDDNRTLPDAVKNALTEAEKNLQKAGDMLQTPPAAATPEKAAAQQAEAVENASEALQQARAEIEAALADTKRQELAVKIGELARASESLERAAAAERQVADKAREAAQDKGLTAEQAQALKQNQADINAVAKKVADGVQATAPEAAKMLSEVQADGQTAEQQLQAAAAQPGEASKPQAQATQDNANKAAQKLSQAAGELRKQIAATAQQLAQEAAAQQKPVAAAREAVESTLRDSNKELAARMEKLAAAAQQVRTAEKTQQKASGRPEAAQAMQLQDQIAAAQAQQAEAANAAAELNSGTSDNPLDAARAQQSVADQAQDLAKAAAQRDKGVQAKAANQPDPLSQKLQQAQEAAAKAAKATLDRNAPEATAARAEAQAALAQAQELAKAEAQAAKQTPAGKPDAAAQRAVAQEAAAAKKLAQGDAPEAGRSLEQATQTAEAATAEAEKGEAGKPQPAQEQTATGLEQARQQLQQAMTNLGKEEGKELSKQADKTDKVAMQTAAVDAGANAAVQDAENAAERGAEELSAAEPSGPMGEPPLAQAKAVEQSLERAAANLAAREQRLQRDQLVAEAIARMAQQQQKAVDEIGKKREEFAQTPQKAPADPAEPMTPAKAAAARDLAQAQEEFANAQRATGQGAEEISGQHEVANRPIREALQLASQLGQVPLEPLLGKPKGVEVPGEKGKPEIDANSGKPGDQPNGQKPGEQPGGQKPGDQKSGDSPMGSQEGAQATGENAPAELGTGFVPDSPEVTAQRMAGPKAPPPFLAKNAAKAKRPGKAGKPTDEPSDSNFPDAPPEDDRGEDPSAKSPTALAQSAQKGQQSKKPNSKNQSDDEKPSDPNEGESAGGLANRDSDAASQQFKEDAWFAKLPPDLRQAIRAKSQRRPPKAYEERLRRYFQSSE